MNADVELQPPLENAQLNNVSSVQMKKSTSLIHTVPGPIKEAICCVNSLVVCIL